MSDLERCINAETIEEWRELYSKLSDDDKVEALMHEIRQKPPEERAKLYEELKKRGAKS